MNTATLYERVGGYDAVAAVIDTRLRIVQRDGRTRDLQARRCRQLKVVTEDCRLADGSDACFESRFAINSD